MERKNNVTHLLGLPAGPGLAEGPAVVVKPGSIMPRLTGRTILVCDHPSRELALLLPFLSGLITERGGQTASAVIQAREQGIPVILGVAQATEAIQDGDYLRMDGGRGHLEVTR
jgi:pyruvate,water dikinase